MKVKKTKKSKFSKIVGRAAVWMRLIFLTLLAGAVSIGLYISSMNPNDYKERIISEIESSSGLDFDAEGKISWKISLRPVINFKDVSATSPRMKASVDDMSVRINLISLLRDNVSIERIEMSGLNVEILEAPAGQKRAKIASEMLASGQRPMGVFPAEEFMLRNPVIKFSGQIYRPQIISLTMDRRSDADTANVRIVSGRDVYELRAVMANLNEERKIYPIRATLTGGGLDLTANLALEKTSLIPIDFNLSGDAANLAAPLQKLGIDAPKVLPLNIVAAGGFGMHDLKIRKLELKSKSPRAANDATISGHIDWKGSVRPNVAINIKSNRLSLAEFFPNLYSQKSEVWTRPDRPLNVFKDTSFPVEMLIAWDARVDLDLRSLIVYRELEISDAVYAFELSDSKFAHKLNAKIANGDIENAVVGEIKDYEIYATAVGLGERIYVSNVLDEVGQKGFISRLPANFEFALQANGGNLERLMATTTGGVLVHSVGRGFAHQDAMAFLYGKDFISTITDDIKNLFATESDEDQVRISCAVANMKIRNGFAETTRGIALESNVFNINIAGDVDLGQEQVRASITSHPSSGLRLSVTGDLTSLFEFEGSLAEPDIRLNQSGLLGKAAATGAGIALAPFTGGASIAVGAGLGWIGGNLISSWLSDSNPCKTAMEESSAPILDDDSEFMKTPVAQSFADVSAQAALRLNQ